MRLWKSRGSEMSAPAKQRTGTGIYAPPGFPLRQYLGKLNNAALVSSAAYRRAICQYDALMWALVYFPHHLRAPETDGQLSFCQFHVDMAHAARRWVPRDLKPAEVRDAWIAPRGAGKSSWSFLILPAWAMAFGHRKLIAAYAHNSSQTRRHLSNLKQEFETNELLQRDFPDLVTPASKRRGGTVADTQEAYFAKSGVAILAHGIDSQTLGTKVGSQRPDLCLLDDIEPDGSNYSIHQKDKRLETIRNAIFGLNDRAVIQMVGTVTMSDSLMHDLVRMHLGQKVSDWVREERINTHYYEPILTDEDGSERSMWPQRWSLEYLKSIEHTRAYSLNFLNQPVNPGGTFWKRTDFTYDAPRQIDERVLAVDPAVSRKETSDDSGLSVVGYSFAYRKAVVELASGLRASPAELRERVHQLCRANPTIRTVLVETNQGGDVWDSVFAPLPGNAKLVLTRSSSSKAERFAKVLDYYQRGLVSHARAHVELEDQMCAFPRGARDDIVDAACAALEFFLKDRPRAVAG